MPVTTLTLAWSGKKALPCRYPGWTIEICGGSQPIDMSSHKFIKGSTAPYLHEGWGKYVGKGPTGWLLTPYQQPLLGKEHGEASMDKLPMGFVTLFLEALEKQGYHVVASHSMSNGKNSAQSVWMWTLKYVPFPSQLLATLPTA